MGYQTTRPRALVHKSRTYYNGSVSITNDSQTTHDVPLSPPVDIAKSVLLPARQQNSQGASFAGDGSNNHPVSRVHIFSSSAVRITFGANATDSTVDWSFWVEEDY